jgi:hypothetical protein
MRKARHKYGLTLLAALALIAPVLAGQGTTGTITLSGAVPAACSLTDTGNAALSTTMALGSVAPAANNTLVTASASARIRGNKAYVLSAQASALVFTGLAPTAGGNTLSLADIGFGVTALTYASPNVAAGSDTVVTGPPTFDYRTTTFPTPVNGLTPFVAGTHGTLNNITSNTQIQSGTRMSIKGNNISTTNYGQETFGIALLPQYFTPNTSFSTTVTLTITCP